ncbi:MAG: hypothetical protein GX640_08390 [Fibrobacter sp.]|nr:hypothetical protein [Fibrobacter sp.]
MNIRFSLVLFQILLPLFTALAFEPGWLSDFYGKNAGHTTCNFLTLPVSSGVLSRGLASSPGMMDATDLPYFSANSALSNRNKFAVNHLEWVMGLRKEYIGALFPLRDIGTAGFFAQVFTPGRFEDARDIDEQPSYPSLVELSIGASFARSFLKKIINIGVSLSYLESHLDKEAGRGLAGSVDLLVIPKKWISTRINVSNVGRAITYTSVPASLPLQSSVSVLLYPLPDYLPFTSKFNFNIGAGLRKMSDEPLVAGGSLEFILGNFANAYTGYEYTLGTASSGISGLGFGVGFHRGSYGIDLALKTVTPEWGAVWSTTLKMQLQEIVKRGPEDYFTLAQKLYNRKLTKLSLHYAKVALRHDPNKWQARALINKIRSDELRKKKLEFAIIYTGSIKGQFQLPLNAAEPGGLARMTSAIKLIQEQFPLSFLIEPGNLITPLTYKPRAELAGFFLKHIGFDAIASGRAEVQYGAEKFKEIQGFSNVVLSNTYEGSPFISHRIIQKDGYKIFVGSYVNGASLGDKDNSKLTPFTAEELLPAEAANCDVRIVILDDTWKNIQVHAKSLSDANIIICNNIDQPFNTPMRSGNTNILSAGGNGRYVGYYVMRFDENKRLISSENRLVPLTSEIPLDSVIMKKVDHLSVEADIKSLQDTNTVKTSTDGVFPFISDRDGKGGIYLKLTGRNAEVPFSRQYGQSSFAAYSFTVSKLAFIINDSDNCKKLVITGTDGTGTRFISDNNNISDAVFSTDGKWLYYSAAPCGSDKTDIYRTLALGGPSYLVLQWNESAENSISFSPDNSLMVFCSNRDGNNQIFMSSTSGDQPLRITDASATHIKPQFSPDGNLISYLSDRYNFGGKLDLWIFNRKTGEHSQITRNSNVTSYCWLSNSRTIILASGSNIQNLSKVDLPSLQFSNITSQDSIKTYQECNPHTIMINNKEAIIYERHFEEGDIKIYKVNPDGTEESCLIDSKGRDWLIGQSIHPPSF